MEGWKECMESYAVTRRFLRYRMTGGEVIIDNPTITALR